MDARIRNTLNMIIDYLERDLLQQHPEHADSIKTVAELIKDKLA